MTRFFIPRFISAGWSSDGEHWDDFPATGTGAEGRSIGIAWLGLHIELIVAVERRRKPRLSEGE